MISTGQGLLSHNMYIYCLNNYINMYDSTGMKPTFAISTPQWITNSKAKQKETFNNLVNKIEVYKSSLPDYTESLNKILIANTYEMMEIKENFGGAVSAIEFYNSVNHNGRWDYKRAEQWKKDITEPFVPKFIFNGKITTPADFGNLHYSFVGMEIGFTPTILCMGGGYAHGGIRIEMFIPPNYGDLPEDHYMVQYGINLYNSYFK